MKNLWTPEQIKWLRDREGWTQEELAQSLGIAFATLSRWENGHSTPSASHQKSLDSVAKVAWMATVPHFLVPHYDIKSRLLTLRYLENRDGGEERKIEIPNPKQQELDAVMAIAFADPWDELEGEKSVPACLEPYFAAKHDIPACFAYRDTRPGVRDLGKPAGKKNGD